MQPLLPVAVRREPVPASDHNNARHEVLRPEGGHRLHVPRRDKRVPGADTGPVEGGRDTEDPRAGRRERRARRAAAGRPGAQAAAQQRLRLAAEAPAADVRGPGERRLQPRHAPPDHHAVAHVHRRAGRPARRRCHRRGRPRRRRGHAADARGGHRHQARHRRDDPRGGEGEVN